MSLTLDNLQKLKRQAGGEIAAREPADSSLPHAPLRKERGSGAQSIDYLRQLLRVRAPTPPTVRADTDRSLPGIEVPYVSAIVDLDGGGTVKGNLINIEPNPEKIRLGMPVEVVYKDALGRKDREGNSYLSYFFQPRR